MKKVYFVRHGESVGNAEGVFKSPDAELIAEGHDQSQSLARRCKILDLDIVISSPNRRAVQTAEYIAKESDISIEAPEFFGATKYASKMLGKSKEGPEADEYVKILQEIHRNNPLERYEDAENFNDLTSRFTNGFNYLAARPEQTILVVTHQSILKSLMVHALLEGQQTIAQHASTKKALSKLDHLGITEMQFNNGRWQLVTWNDRSYFAE